MNKTKQAIEVIKWQQILFLICFIGLFFIPVNAVQAQNGSIEYTPPASQIIYGGGGNPSSVGDFYSIPWITNFNTISRPDFLILYTTDDEYVVGSATFYINDTLGNVYATGDFQALNGTNLGGNLAKQYYYFKFNTWNPNGRTGKVYGNLTVLPANIETKSIWRVFKGSGGGSPSKWGDGGLDAAPTGVVGTTFVCSGDKGGVYQPLAASLKVQYSTVLTGGSGSSISSRVEITRVGNELVSKFNIIKPIENTVYTSSFSSSTLSEGVDVIGSDYYISMYLPYDTKYYNSTRLWLPNNTYDYTFNPTTFSISQKTQGTISGDTANLKFYEVEDVTVGTTRPIFYNTLAGKLYSFNFYKNATAWNGFNNTYGYDVSFGAALPNNLQYTFYEGGERTLKIVTIDTSDVLKTIYKNVTVSGAGSFGFTLFPLDYTTSNFITGATLSIKDRQTLGWINRTVYTPDDCTFYLNSGWYDIWANALGYLQQHNGDIHITAPTNDQILLFPQSSVGVNNTLNSTVIIKVQTEPNLNPLAGANIVVSGVTLPQPLAGVTSYGGVASFSLQNLTTYKAVMTAQGYQTVTLYFTTNSNPHLVTMVTTTGSGSPITYSTTIATPLPTTLPIPTPQSWSNASASQCGNLQSNSSFLDYGKNLLACNGFETGLSQSLVIAALIILSCLYVGARFGRGIGSAIGAIIGFVLSFALGVIPFMILALVIVLLVLVIAIIITTQSR